ncbi:MAG TPA: ABC transporter substrate-binding protein [Myxococcota bacterium]|nr:ABC transporter substrate-binding protein [Myxococcota bacterium]
MRFTRTLCAVVFAAASLSIGSPVPADPAATEPAASGPSQSIDGLHAALLDVMKNAKSLGYEGRAAKLTPVIPRYFDVSFMAEKSVGVYWEKASEAERKRYLDAFLRFMVANYAGQFDSWTGQSFQTLGEDPARMDTKIVRSKLIDPGDEDVELNYRMHQIDGTWKIIDVYLDGTVSELALRRSEFSGIVKRENFDALIAALDEKIAKLAAGNAAKTETGRKQPG